MSRTSTNKVPPHARFGQRFLMEATLLAALAAVGILFLICVSRENGEAQPHATVIKADPAGPPRPAASFGKMPLSFERNTGQADASVSFLSRAPGYTLVLARNEAVLSIEGSRTPAPITLRMKLAGANPAASVAALEELPGKRNYLIGNDPAKWHTNVPTYAKVKYQNVYPGIDLIYYGNPQQLEYDFLVAPGADPSPIALEVSVLSPSGENRGLPLHIDSNGNLVKQTGEYEVRLHKPVVYQAAEDSTKQFVDGKYTLTEDGQVTFSVAAYDRGKLLVIDPVLTYSTYLGASETGNWREDIAVDTSGHAYLIGSTTSTDLPTASPLQAFFGGSVDAFVAKLTPDGSALVYSTYLGGSNAENGLGIAVDPAGHAYVTGWTGSADFPTASPLQTAPDGLLDAFVAKLTPDGSALVYSTYLGGSNIDVGVGITVDASGSAYVTGNTRSTDFPTTSPLQAVRGGGSDAGDAFVTKLTSDGSVVVYSTYLGGSGSDFGLQIAVDPWGRAYVTGGTESTDFPTANPLQVGHGGMSDAFVAKLRPDGSALVYATYVGGSGGESGSGITVDTSGSAYVTGGTSSTDFPTAGALQAVRRGQSDAFVAKLTPDGSALVYSTYLGGSNAENGVDIAIDTSGSVYVTGGTQSTDFPTANPLQVGFGGMSDAFVAQLRPDGSALVYATYLGGSGGESGSGIAVDNSGSAYVTGGTSSTDFPKAGPVQAVFGGGSDVFVAKIESEASDTRPPIISVPRAIIVEATRSDGAFVSFVATATDSDDEAGPVSCTPESGSLFPLGATTVTCSATDTHHNTAYASFVVTVRDTTPPTIVALAPSQTRLWPPNGRIVPITVNTDVADVVTLTPTCHISAVSTNEPATTDQWSLTGPLSLNLVAARNGHGAGRIYSITVTCTDDAGNLSLPRLTTIVVPHDQRR